VDESGTARLETFSDALALVAFYLPSSAFFER